MKVQKTCTRKWMLNDELMDILGILNFNEIVESDPDNLKIIEVEELRNQPVDTIQNMSEVYISSLKMFIMILAQPLVSLQGFLDNW